MINKFILFGLFLILCSVSPLFLEIVLYLLAFCGIVASVFMLLVVGVGRKYRNVFPDLPESCEVPSMKYRNEEDCINVQCDWNDSKFEQNCSGKMKNGDPYICNCTGFKSKERVVNPWYQIYKGENK